MGIDNSARESDSDMNLQELSNMQKRNKTQSGTTSGVADYNGDVSEEENRTEAVQLQILAELKRVNARLDAVEGQVGSSNNGGARQKIEQSKLSSKSSGNHCDKKK